jgi:uncharacterized damage-inducible protein DinB
MADDMNSTQFLEKLHKGRADWDALLAQIPEEQLTIPGASGAWTVKDVIAHIAWHEREMIGMLDGRTMAHGSGLWLLPTDERNTAIYEEQKNRPLADVLDEAPRMYQSMLALINTLSDDELRDPSRFEFMPADWVPWEIIASNTFGHYQQHTPDIQAWVK